MRDKIVGEGQQIVDELEQAVHQELARLGCLDKESKRAKSEDIKQMIRYYRDMT